jgi:hypothetical protein
VSGPRYLVDTSVFARAELPEVRERLEQLAIAGKVWTCRLVDLELAWGSRRRDVERLIADRTTFPEAPITPAVMDRALQVAGLMAARALHRGAKPTDLVIAAAAEARGLAVLHYDDDYDRIAKVTRQPTEWIAEPGSLDH